MTYNYQLIACPGEPEARLYRWDIATPANIQMLFLSKGRGKKLQPSPYHVWQTCNFTPLSLSPAASPTLPSPRIHAAFTTTLTGPPAIIAAGALQIFDINQLLLMAQQKMQRWVPVVLQEQAGKIPPPFQPMNPTTEHVALSLNNNGKTERLHMFRQPFGFWHYEVGKGQVAVPFISVTFIEMEFAAAPAGKLVMSIPPDFDIVTEACPTVGSLFQTMSNFVPQIEKQRQEWPDLLKFIVQFI